MGNQYVGVDRIAPLTMRMASLSWVSIFFTYGLLSQTGAQYSAVEYTNPSADIRRVSADDPQLVPHSL
jgi:hypothetical protein